jgi:hypothetical protein
MHMFTEIKRNPCEEEDKAQQVAYANYHIANADYKVGQKEGLSTDELNKLKATRDSAEEIMRIKTQAVKDCYKGHFGQADHH